MAEQGTSGGSFSTRFLPGLAVGIVVGALAGAFIAPILTEGGATSGTTQAGGKVPVTPGLDHRRDEEKAREASPVEGTAAPAAATTDTAKPAENKPAETKPAEAKPAEPTPAETKPAEPAPK